NLVLVAHGSDEVIEKAKNILEQMGYSVITSRDGVDAMVKIMSQMPFLILIDVALPKIFGFEICKRVKSRKETAGIKILLITSVYGKKRYTRPPEDLHGADDFINEPDIEEQLKDKVLSLLKEPEKETPEVPPKEEPSITPTAPPTTGPEEDALAQRARRLVRTILSDIMLYHKDRAKEAALEGRFREEFASDLQEGLKLYNMRIPPEVRAQRDYFNEEIDKFIEEIKKQSN
ncbi:MAG: response regulator, partial [Nitrospirae bacterium]